ncbi:MAG: cysteine desulfurase family protein [Prochlorotrichaceae cyanobacterium]
MRLYLDYSATTPPRTEAIDRLQWVLSHAWANPSSIHWWGEQAAGVLEEARCQVAQLIGADPTTIVFTSGGTESDNLALLGVTQRYATPQHLIISSVEHSAVEMSARSLEKQGWQVTRLGVDAQGLVSVEALEAAIQTNTVLVSIIYGQNEVGTLQPIPALAAVARAQGVVFHTDAVQLAGRVPLDVEALGVDLLSLSSHKLYGPQGAGALYCRPGVGLEPVQRGGGQEAGLRSGTQGVATIAAFGVAAALAAQELELEQPRLQGLRDRLWSQLQGVPALVWTGAREERLPHHLSFCIDHPQGIPINGKTIVRQLNLASIGISSGSACSSGQTQPSRILKAMGYSDRLALSSLRISLGRSTTLLDMDWVAQVLVQIIERAIAVST